MTDEVNYGSLITATKCYKCIHFPLCMAQKGGVNLGLASENDCMYFQPKLPENAVVLNKYEYEQLCQELLAAEEDRQLARKETAMEIYRKAKAIVDMTKVLVQGKEYLHIDALKELAKQYGVEAEEL